MPEEDMASAVPAPGLRPSGAEPASPSQAKPLVPDAWKGDFDRASWVGRYAEHMMRFGGMQPYEAECWALNAWEASPDDADPDDTASDDLAYGAEDGE